jgi:hypothetical protein
VAGIVETVDLDITPALGRVKQLQSAIDRAANVSVKTDGAQGLGAAAAGLRSVSAEAKAAEGAAQIARRGLADLAGTAAGQLSPQLGVVQSHLGEVRAAFGGASTGALAAAAGIATAGVIIGEMALDGVKHFIDLATQVRSFQRVAGGTAEDASRMVAVFGALNVPVAAGATSFLRLSENVRKHADVLEADGIVIAKNKQGQVDLGATLLNISDAYRAAGSQIDKTKIVVDSFSLRGKALIPILAAGREQIEEFWQAAARHHEIFSQTDLDTARGFKLATYELSQAFGGLEIELGKRIVPALSAAAKVTTLSVEGFDMTVNAVGRVVGSLFGLGKAHKSAADEAKAQASEQAKLQAASASLAAGTGVTSARIEQLAATLNIDLANATDKETKQLSELAAKLNEAITPTQRLASVTDVLSNSESTVAENVKAFKTALDATIGSAIDATTATIGVRDAVTGLAEAIAKGRDKHEGLVTFQDRVTKSATDVVKAVETEADALVRSGQLAADSGSQQAFLRQRLLDVADAVPAVRAQILLYIADLDAIPTSKSTTVDVNVDEALRKLGLVNYAMSPQALQAQRTAYSNPFVVAPNPATDAARQAGIAAKTGSQAGTAAAKALADALSSPASLKLSADSGTKLGNAAAAGATKAVEKTLLLSAKPGQGLDLGGFIVKGIQDGAAQNQIKANNAVLSLAAGMKAVVDKAKVIDPEEALGILQAVANVQKASNDLAATRKKLGANSIEAKIAELSLKDAQAQVNEKLRDATSASKAVADAQKLQKDTADKLKASNDALRKSISDGLSATLSSLSAVRSLAAAQRSLRDAQQSVADLQKRSAELPAEIAAAQAKLNAEKANSAKVTNTEALAVVNARESVASAEKNLDTIRAGSTASVNDLVELTLRLKDAREKLTAAEQDASGNTADVQTAQSGLDAARLTLVPSVVAAAEQKLAEARAAAAAKDTQFQLAVIDARKNVTAAEKSLTDAQAGSTASADDLLKASLEVAVARENLTQATKDSTAATSDETDAASVLKNLQDEQIQVQKDLRSATEDVVDAQLGMVDAQQRLIEGAANIVGSRDAMIAYFQALATQAGLTKGQISDLVTMLDNARRLATTPLKGAPAGGPGTVGQPGVGSSFIDPSTGRTAVTGPNGEGGLVNPSAADFAKYPGLTTYINPYTGTLTGYVPGQNIQAGNQAALDAARRAQNPNIAPVTPNIGVDNAVYTAQPITWNVFPQTAVFDEKTAGAYMQNMELLYA